ncbi:MAG: transglycosylase SLT domain-containing protein [Burkholderiales bacterium]
MRRLLAALLGLLVTASWAAPGDEAFMEARDAAQRNRMDLVARQVPELRAHPLLPYVEQWLLRARLSELPQDEVEDFLGRYQGQLVANRLRAEWLRTLGRRKFWTAFDKDWPALVDPDTELQCLRTQSRWSKGEAQALQEARPLWFTGKEQPDACTAVFDTLFSGGLLREEDLWARARLAFQAGNATLGRALASRFPSWARADDKRLDAAVKNPERYLEARGLSTKGRPSREIALFALGRIAASLPEAGASTWRRIEGQFPREDREYGWGQIAVAGARKHHPEALDWFAKAGDTAFDDTQLEWKARAGLRVQQWKTVLASIDNMSAEMRERAVWRYWRARALRETGRTSEAMPILAALASDPGFHGQLAAEDLGPTVGAAPTKYVPTEDDVRTAAQTPGFRRALAFYRLGLRYEGNLEWIWTVRDLDDVQLLGAAELARREGWYERSIATADKTKRLINLELRYPTPYQDLLRASAKEFDLDDALVYGLVRQESRFNASARSNVGAAGLMQIMPATARWVAQKLGLKEWRHAIDSAPDANVNFGAYYLKQMLTRLEGSAVLASAAYNAGPGRAQGWRGSAPLEGAIYVDTIPFTETRDYVRKVLTNATHYARIFGRTLETLKGRLGTIPPRGGNAGAPTDP